MNNIRTSAVALVAIKYLSRERERCICGLAITVMIIVINIGRGATLTVMDYCNHP